MRPLSVSRQRILLSAALAMLLLTIMWLSSLWLYDAHKTRDALEWRHAVLNGETPYRWDFERRSDVTSGNGLETFSWSGGVLSGNGDDPYIYLNLRGRVIDARRYDRLRISLESDRDSYLQLFHHQGREEVIHYSERLPVAAGTRDVDLGLSALTWRSRNVYVPDIAPRPSAWGSPDGRVTGLRIDPVTGGGFAIDSIALIDSSGTSADPEIITFRDPSDPSLGVLEAAPSSVRFLAHDRWWRTPETAHRVRSAIAERFPSVILFPKPADPGAGPPERRSPLLLPGLLFAGALLIFVLRRLFSAALRDWAGIVAYLAMAGSCLFLEPYLAGWLKTLPLVPLAVATGLLRPKREPGRDLKAWLYLSPVIVVAAVLMLLLYRQQPHESPLWQTLAVYLGWALIQQYVVAVVVFGRLREVSPDHAVVLAAGAFGFLHLPNFALMAGTFLLGLYLLRVYRCHPNLPALAFTHALAAVGVNLATPGWLWLSREVGPRFLEAL